MPDILLNIILRSNSVLAGSLVDSAKIDRLNDPFASLTLKTGTVFCGPVDPGAVVLVLVRWPLPDGFSPGNEFVFFLDAVPRSTDREPYVFTLTPPSSPLRVPPQERASFLEIIEEYVQLAHRRADPRDFIISRLRTPFPEIQNDLGRTALTVEHWSQRHIKAFAELGRATGVGADT